ncbi:MAG: hypothetical protein LBH06_01250 [Rikenellaceae bacterium]|jgi:hypothetical protein|nr:hypothetical protein [Rikenellaceae bacterium]
MKITIKRSEAQGFEHIEVREPLVSDMVEAKKHGDEISIASALISQICTFDGKQITMEDVQRLPLTVFLDLQLELTQAGLLGSDETLSLLSGKDASATTA